MKKIFASVAAALAMGVAVPALAGGQMDPVAAPLPLPQGTANGLTPAQQDDLRLAAEDICSDWLIDSGAACTPAQETATLRLLEGIARAGVFDIEAYEAGLTQIFGRVPFNREMAANNRAASMVAEYCTTNFCGRWQYTQLIEVLKAEMLREAPASDEERLQRQQALQTAIGAIMAQDPNVRPADMPPVTLIVFIGAESRGVSAADAADQVCHAMAEENLVPCTPDKVAAITEIITRYDAMPAPETERARRAQLRELTREMETAFFPRVSAVPAAQPAGPR